jgi:hypothetical protein
MGDGHHGWACAEVLHAVRDALVHERWWNAARSCDLVLCAGVPKTWFRPGAAFGIQSTSTPHGLVSISVESNGNEILINTDMKEQSHEGRGRWVLALPFVAESVIVNGVSDNRGMISGGETRIEFTPASVTIQIRRSAG